MSFGDRTLAPHFDDWYAIRFAVVDFGCSVHRYECPEQTHTAHFGHISQFCSASLSLHFRVRRFLLLLLVLRAVDALTLNWYLSSIKRANLGANRTDWRNMCRRGALFRAANWAEMLLNGLHALQSAFNGGKQTKCALFSLLFSSSLSISVDGESVPKRRATPA